MDAYASHQQLLIASAMQSTGHMVELGCGDYSTPLLAEIAAEHGRTYEVYTTDREWGSKYTSLCKINYIESWDNYPYPECGFAFLDNEQFVRDRKLLVPRLLETAEVVMCHDFGDNQGAKYSTTLHGNPPSIVMSNTIDVQMHTLDIINEPDDLNFVATVCVVYKTGGDYTAEYVHRLYAAVCANTTLPFDFHTYTDSDEELPGTVIPLTDDLPGWWSKIELFKSFFGRAVYLDLDTVITGNIDRLLAYDGPMAMLKDFCPPCTEMASGVMAWNSPMQIIYQSAMKEIDHIRANPKEWDQKFIVATLQYAHWQIDTVQDIIPLHSYKVHCLKGIPDDARIVCFHGKPRPHEVAWLDSELQELPVKSTRDELANKFEGIGVELGVAKGHYSSRILRNRHVDLLYSVDRWSDHHGQAEYMNTLYTLAHYGQKSIVVRATFDEALDYFDDASLDFIYIDGYAHTGQAGGKTLDDWWPKLKPGGIFSGHDYHSKWPLTVQAVDEFAAAHDLQIDTTDDDEYPSWMVVK